MKKLSNFYLFGTTFPIIILFIESIIPYNYLKEITILADEIKRTNFSGSIFTLIIIFLGLIILNFKLSKGSYSYSIKLSNNSIWLLSFYSIYRFISAGLLYLNSASLNYSRNQIAEIFTKPGFQGFIIKVLNSIYPLITTIIFVAFFTINNSDLKNKEIKIRRRILIAQLVLFFTSSTLFDLSRNSRGNITFFGISFIVSLIIIKNPKIKFFKFKNFLVSLILILFISFSFLGTTFNRFYKASYDLDIDIMESINLTNLVHDSTIYKAVGGQLITNMGVSDNLYLNFHSDQNFLGFSNIDKSTLMKRDYFCRRFDCLFLFQPIYLIAKILGYDKYSEGLYVDFGKSFPYNSFSHLGALYVTFNKSIAPIVYLLLLLINFQFLQAKSVNLEFISVFNLMYFSLMAFTDNWFMTLFPYISIFFILFSGFLGIKIYRSE